MCSLCTEGRHHHPRAKGPSNLRILRPPGRSILSTFLYNPLNPHAAGVSNAALQHRHLERSRMPVWTVKTSGFIETLSREISRFNASSTMEKNQNFPDRRKDGSGKLRFWHRKLHKKTSALKAEVFLCHYCLFSFSQALLPSSMAPMRPA